MLVKLLGNRHSRNLVVKMQNGIIPLTGNLAMSKKITNVFTFYLTNLTFRNWSCQYTYPCIKQVSSGLITATLFGTAKDLKPFMFPVIGNYSTVHSIVHRILCSCTQRMRKLSWYEKISRIQLCERNLGI